MTDVPTDLRYTDSHEWVRSEGDGLYTIGITEHAQAMLGDVVFVEMPEMGNHFQAGDSIALIESVKAASDIYSPISGEVVAMNQELEDSPHFVNEEPYADGWILQIKAADSADYQALRSAEQYAANIADE